MTLTKEVGKYISSGNFNLPNEIVEAVKISLLDWIAVTISGSGEDAPKIVRKSLNVENVAGNTTVIGTKTKTLPYLSSLVNGTAAHALDFDDVHVDEPGHPGAVVNSAAFAVAESINASGYQLIEAIATGIHVMFSVNSGMMPEHYAAGWHNTGTLGHMGSTAAAAKLLGLDENKCIHALGIAGIQMAGLRASFGNMGKPFHAGKAAMNGVISASLASNGFIAPEDIIGGKNGLLEVMTPQARPERILETLYGENQVKFLRYKRFSSCLATHSTIENAIELKNAFQIKSEDIEKIICTVYPRLLEIAAIENPVTGLEGKFSVKFCAAAALLKGCLSPEDFNEKTVALPEITNLMSKIVLVPENSYTEGRSAKMNIITKDGSEYCHFTDLKELQADQEKQKKDVIEKYRTISSAILKPDAVEPLLEHIMNLDSLPDVTKLSHFLNNINY